MSTFETKFSIVETEVFSVIVPGAGKTGAVKKAAPKKAAPDLGGSSSVTPQHPAGRKERGPSIANLVDKAQIQKLLQGRLSSQFRKLTFSKVSNCYECPDCRKHFKKLKQVIQHVLQVGGACQSWRHVLSHNKASKGGVDGVKKITLPKNPVNDPTTWE